MKDINKFPKELIYDIRAYREIRNLTYREILHLLKERNIDISLQDIIFICNMFEPTPSKTSNKTPIDHPNATGVSDEEIIECKKHGMTYREMADYFEKVLKKKISFQALARRYKRIEKKAKQAITKNQNTSNSEKEKQQEEFRARLASTYNKFNPTTNSGSNPNNDIENDENER